MAPRLVLFRATAAVARFGLQPSDQGSYRLLVEMAGSTLNDASSAELEAVLLERARIASEVHQGALQDLGALLVLLDLTQQHMESDVELARMIMAQMRLSVRGALDSLRSAVLHLTPVVPDKGNIDPDDLGRFVRAYGLECEMKITFEVRGRRRPIPSETMAFLFAFAQEGITNIHKHADQREASVLIAFGEGEIDLAVQHRGSAFAVDDARLGHGLSLMRSRARLLGGDLRLVTRDGWMELTLDVPG